MKFNELCLIINDVRARRNCVNDACVCMYDYVEWMRNEEGETERVCVARM